MLARRKNPVCKKVGQGAAADSERGAEALACEPFGGRARCWHCLGARGKCTLPAAATKLCAADTVAGVSVGGLRENRQIRSYGLGPRSWLDEALIAAEGGLEAIRDGLWLLERGDPDGLGLQLLIDAVGSIGPLLAAGLTEIEGDEACQRAVNSATGAQP